MISSKQGAGREIKADLDSVEPFKLSFEVNMQATG